jgi:hypothetical protein
MVKITVRTSVSSGRLPASAFTLRTGFYRPQTRVGVDPCPRVRAWIRVVRTVVRADAALGGQIRVLRIKGGALRFFPHFQPIPVE